MSSKKMKRLRSQITALLDQWAGPLGFYNWRNTSVFHANEDDYCAAGGTPDGAMMCTAQWEYLSIHLDINLTRCALLDVDDLEYVVLHELCHALVCEMREYDPNGKHEERVVTQLARKLIEVRAAALRGELNTNAPNS
jgi:hypothetical protein